MNNKVVINNIKKWLKENNLSQIWLAEQIKVSTSMLSQMLNGERKLQTKHLLSISKVTGMTPNRLAEDETKKVSNEPKYVLRGAFSSKKSERDFSKLLWDVKCYVDLEAITHE